jgi:glycosyltransferase involved in cell wall biosynthesis
MVTSRALQAVSSHDPAVRTVARRAGCVTLSAVDLPAPPPGTSADAASPAAPAPGEHPAGDTADPARTARVIVVMPAYNAALTLERTYADIPHDIVDHVILVDDVSRDETVEIAKRLGLEVIVHRQNRGYGGNQKTCYAAALEAGAEVVVMLHPDYQYDATRIPALVEPIARGQRDLMLGSRFLGDPLAGGMPKWKFVANRFLTTIENVAFGLRLSEYHTGLRAYSRELLETIPYQLNSDDFVFDQELIAQVVAAGKGSRIGEIAVPTRYFEEASSVGFRRSVVYGLSTLRVVARFLLHRLRVRRSPKLVARRPQR